MHLSEGNGSIGLSWLQRNEKFHKVIPPILLKYQLKSAIIQPEQNFHPSYLILSKLSNEQIRNNATNHLGRSDMHFPLLIGHPQMGS